MQSIFQTTEFTHMQIVTLTTDWGYSDYYIGVVKGRLYSTIEDVNIVDITHNIRKYDLLAAAFVVKNACLEYPEGTIHIIDVDSYETVKKEGEDRDRSFIAVKYRGQYYICVDNGLPSIVFEDDEVEIVQITSFNESNYFTFAALDLFVKIAKNIAVSKQIDFLGIKRDKFINKITKPYPIIERDRIVTEVIYIDGYGNAFLNITDEMFKNALNGRGFEIVIDKRATVNKLSQSYADATKTDTVMLTISATGALQLAIKKGSVQKLLGLRVGSSVVIDIV